uniref:Uncharacterized protein n=1 Tax=Fagus sylvatica TaxID=28930 RepID=A0A2N9GL47_FAGSY
MAPGSRGIGAVFVHFPAKIPIKRGMLSANREFHDVAGVIIFPTHPGSRSTCCEQERLCARRRLSGRKNAFCSQRVFSQILSQFARIFDLAPDVDFDVLGTVGKLALPILQGSGLAGIRAWTREIWPASRVHRVSTCCESGRLCAQARNVGGKFRKFQHSLISSPVFTRVVDVAPDVGFDDLGIAESLLPIFNGTGLAQSFGHNSSFLVRFRPVKYESKLSYFLPGLGWSVRSVFGLVNSPVKPWSNLVEFGQNSPNSWKCTRTSFQGFWAGDPVGLEQLGQTSVKLRSTLVKPGQTLGNVSGPSSWSI